MRRIFQCVPTCVVSAEDTATDRVPVCLGILNASNSLTVSWTRDRPAGFSEAGGADKVLGSVEFTFEVGIGAVVETFVEDGRSTKMPPGSKERK